MFILLTSRSNIPVRLDASLLDSSFFSRICIHFLYRLVQIFLFPETDAEAEKMTILNRSNLQKTQPNSNNTYIMMCID